MKILLNSNVDAHRYILLEHGHAPLFGYCLWLPLGHKGQSCAAKAGSAGPKVMKPS